MPPPSSGWCGCEAVTCRVCLLGRGCGRHVADFTRSLLLRGTFVGQEALNGPDPAADLPVLPRGLTGIHHLLVQTAGVAAADAVDRGGRDQPFRGYPITPFMGPSKEGTWILHFGQSSTNISKDMCAGNRPNFNSESGLTSNGRGPAGERPGSARERNAAGSPRASRPALRRLFASGTPASAEAAPDESGGLPAAVDELAAPLGHPSRNAGVVAVEVAAAAPADGVETEVSSRPGTAAGPDEPDAQPARWGHGCVGRRVDVLADVACPNPSTPPPDGMAATRR